jgi:hypothetical protein
MAMLINRGGQRAARGTYWNLTNGQRVDLAPEEGILPENNRTLFIRMPAAGVLLAGPILGLLYAVFLPFIGIAMALVLIGEKLLSGAMQVAVKSTGFGWSPVEAYLEGRRKKKEQTRSPKDGKK